MPAMHDNVLSAMIKQLEHHLRIYLRTVPFSMTHEECIHLVAPADHVDILTKAAEYADLRSSENWMTVQVPANIDGCTTASVSLRMRTHAQKAPPLVPRTPWWQMPTEQNRAAGDKVIAWLTKRYELGRRFGTVSRVLYDLNHMCENGHQLRYMFPAVLNLCKEGMDYKMDRWMDKHGAYKVCKFTPAVSPELKRGIQDSAALLTSCVLLGDEVPQQLPEFVDISAGSLLAFKFNGDIVARM